MDMALKVFCNADLIAPARAELEARLAKMGGCELLWTDGPEGVGDAGLLSADVAFGQPPVAEVARAARLKYVQLTSAGWARYETPEVLGAMKARSGVICNASSVFAEPCAQHALAFMLSEARRLGEMWRGPDPRARRWASGALREECRLLGEQQVVLVGYGAIARRLVELLAPFRMTIRAFRRNVRGDEVVRTYPIIAVDELLPDADHVVNILPGTASTARFFDARRLSLIKPSAVFYNIGRGSTVEQPALAERLRGGKLRAAYLDVTDPEPLPPEHELWGLPNCYISPHSAGGFSGEDRVQVAHFVGNLTRYIAGERLIDRVA